MTIYAVCRGLTIYFATMTGFLAAFSSLMPHGDATQATRQTGIIFACVLGTYFAGIYDDAQNKMQRQTMSLRKS